MWDGGGGGVMRGVWSVREAAPGGAQASAVWAMLRAAHINATVSASMLSTPSTLQPVRKRTPMSSAKHDSTAR